MAKWEFWRSKRKVEETETIPWGYERYPTDTMRSSLYTAEEDWDVTHAKPVFTSAPPSAVSRPRSYEELMRARGGGGASRYYDSPQTGRRYFEEEESTPLLSMHRMMQLLGAVALTGVLYFTFHSESPTAVSVQSFVTKHLTEDSNFSQVTAWWQSNVSDKVDVPAMSNNVKKTGGTDPVAFVMPVQGAKVKNAFDGKEQQGISFTAALGAQVHAAAKGTVEKIEKGEGDEYAITINHGGDQGRTLYSHLAAVSVAANDVVESDQSIGTLTKKGTTAPFFFAYQKDGSYVDPNGLLPHSNADSNPPATTPNTSANPPSGA